MDRRIITTEFTSEDVKIENNLRPSSLDEYIGQTAIKENLKVFIEADKSRNPLTIAFFTDLRDLARPLLPG